MTDRQVDFMTHIFGGQKLEFWGVKQIWGSTYLGGQKLMMMQTETEILQKSFTDYTFLSNIDCRLKSLNKPI